MKLNEAVFHVVSSWYEIPPLSLRENGVWVGFDALYKGVCALRVTKTKKEIKLLLEECTKII